MSEPLPCAEGGTYAHQARMHAFINLVNAYVCGVYIILHRRNAPVCGERPATVGDPPAASSAEAGASRRQIIQK